MSVISTENGFLPPMLGTHIKRFSLELSGKIRSILVLHLYEDIVSITIRCNKWSVRNFTDVVLLEFGFFYPSQDCS